MATIVEMELTGYPDKEKVVLASGSDASMMADYSLHCHDLQVAADCLRELSLLPTGPIVSITQRALWLTAISNYSKCFGKDTRTRLKADEVFAGTPPAAMTSHNFYVNLRNKQLIHHDNSFTQALPMAVIAKAGGTRNVLGVVSAVHESHTNSPEGVASLSAIVDHAFKWSKSKMDEHNQRLHENLEKLPRDQLLGLPTPEYAVPQTADVGTTRQTHK